MPKIRIWNDNTVAYKENFKGEEIMILPGKYKDMEVNEGIQFLGTFKQPEYDGSGVQTIESMKKLRKEIIEPLFADPNAPKIVSDTDSLVCPVCKKVCVDQEHLDGHINANHLNEMADKKEKARRMTQLSKGK